jgi:hypothetical protein
VAGYTLTPLPSLWVQDHAAPNRAHDQVQVHPLQPGQEGVQGDKGQGRPAPWDDANERRVVGGACAPTGGASTRSSQSADVTAHGARVAVPYMDGCTVVAERCVCAASAAAAVSGWAGRSLRRNRSRRPQGHRPQKPTREAASCAVYSVCATICVHPRAQVGLLCARLMRWRGFCINSFIDHPAQAPHFLSVCRAASLLRGGRGYHGAAAAMTGLRRSPMRSIDTVTSYATERTHAHVHPLQQHSTAAIPRRGAGR